MKLHHYTPTHTHTHTHEQIYMIQNTELFCFRIPVDNDHQATI